jgi:hypothetical protein
MLPCLDAFNNVWQAARLSASSAQYRRWNSFHLAGSWLNQRRRSSLGARFLHHASMCSASFFIPRGHKRSTRKRAPSSFVEGSYTRLIWITAKLHLRTLNLDSHRPSAAALLGYTKQSAQFKFRPKQRLCRFTARSLIGRIFDADECRKSKTFISGLCWVLWLRVNSTWP